MFDCLRHVSAEITLRFEADALRVAELAGTNTLYIYAELFATHFESYDTPPREEGEIRIDAYVVCPSHVHTILSSITRRVRGDADVLLQLTFAPKKGGRCGTLELALRSSGVDEDFDTTYELPCRVARPSEHGDGVAERAAQLFTGEGYAHTMYMSQRHLSHLVSHVFPLGQYIELYCEPQAVHFCVTDKHAMISRAHVCFRMAPGEPPSKRRKERAGESDCADGRSRGFCFSQPLLTMLIRAMSLYNTTAVLLPGGEEDDADRPVIMRATVGDLGNLSVAIAQVTPMEDDGQTVEES